MPDGSSPPEATPEVGVSQPPGLGRGELFAYALPMAAFMGVTMPLSLYLMKFSVDVLLISPAAMGLIVGLSRLWDAVTDPLAGHLSDRTHSRLGRRRSWMLASAIPISLTLFMVWSPPSALEGAVLVLWIAVAMILYETTSTAFVVPYAALGLELSTDYHERTRIFAWRHLVGSAGFAMGMVMVYLLRTSEDPRGGGTLVAAISGVVVLATVGFAVARLREPAHHQDRGGLRITDAFRDVFRNSHARLLFAVYGIEAFGGASISAMSPFVMEYIVKAPDSLELFVASYALPQFIFTPIWLRASRRLGKKRLWMLGMIPMIVGFGGMVFLSEGSVALPLFLVFLIGIGGGIASVVAPAIQADVIDYDELQTGERKEGAYTAVWNFIRKSGWGVAMLFTGFLLEGSGYEANAEQPESAKTMILLLIGAIPAAGYLAGLVLMSRFRLSEQEHGAIRRQLGEREE